MQQALLVICRKRANEKATENGGGRSKVFDLIDYDVRRKNQDGNSGNKERARESIHFPKGV